MGKSFLLFAAGAALAMGLPAGADPVGYTLDADLGAGALTVDLFGGDASYTFSFNGDGLSPISVAVGGTGEVYGNGFFSPNEPDPLEEGAIVPDQLSLGEFFQPTGAVPIQYSVAMDWIALSFTSGGNTYYGYAEVGGSTLYRLGYNDTPGGSIATGEDFRELNPSGSVPEPASWAMMITGFGLVGGAARRTRRAVALA